MNESAVRTSRWNDGRGPVARSWRIRPWPNDPDACLLVLLDHLATPTAAELRAAVDAAHDQGAVVVRTSALFPRAAEVALGSGFEAIDTLVLLRLGLDAELDAELDARFGAVIPRTRPMRAWHRRTAARTDVAAFGATWGNDAGGLTDIEQATPVHRARMVRDGRRVDGFAISGAARANGYLQRLSVLPGAQRRGIGRDLVVDAIRWMRRRGCTTAYVNTGVGNEAALALYRGLGFEATAERLTIAEHRRPA